jgi:hypothetical protein
MTAERLKVVTEPSLALQNLTEALKNQKGLHNERKEKRPCTVKLRIEDITAAMRKAEDITVACPIFQLFGSAARCA